MNIFSKEMLFAGGSKAFVRPNLTANGTLGGSSFAVQASSEYSASRAAFYAVDGTNGYWRSSGSSATYTFYNPNPLNVTKIIFNYGSATYSASSVTVQVSNNNSSWRSITSNYSGTATGTLTLTNTYYYKYYKLSFTASGSQIRLMDLQITAEEQ